MLGDDPFRDETIVLPILALLIYHYVVIRLRGTEGGRNFGQTHLIIVQRKASFIQPLTVQNIRKTVNSIANSRFFANIVEVTKVGIINHKIFVHQFLDDPSPIMSK